jgi:thiamine-phosphate pyrophosphorylase
VHLGRTDEGAARARENGLLLGLSATSLEEARAADSEADYIGVGPIWETPSKADADPAIGLDGLREICDATTIPVVAIGGIDATNAAECIRAGAVGVAVVRAARDAAAVRAALDAAL